MIVLPHSEEAEKAVLGSLLLDPEILNEVFSLLKEEDFYYPPHKIIYQSIKELYDEHKPVDIITLTQHLKEKGFLDKAGGVSYVSSLSEIVPTTENFNSYVEIVKEKSIRRGLIKIANEIIGHSLDNNLEMKDIIDIVERKILKITEITYKENFVSLRELLWNIVNDIEKRLKSEIDYLGLRTGYKKLDEITSGLQEGTLIVLAARPSMGKTTFALNLAANMAFDYDYKVAFFSLEVPATAIGYKLISRQTKIPFDDVRKGNISIAKMTEVINLISDIIDKPLYIDSSPNITVFEIKQKARRLKVKYGLDIIFIDYLQIIMPPKGIKAENKNVAISEISRGLKSLARELKIPVVVISQLSRAVEKRDDKRPLLSDLRESGAIEQDADIVAFLYRESYYERKKRKGRDQEEENPAGKDVTELLIKKHRNGRRGKILYKFYPEYSYFEELEEVEDFE